MVLGDGTLGRPVVSVLGAQCGPKQKGCFVRYGIKFIEWCWSCTYPIQAGREYSVVASDLYLIDGRKALKCQEVYHSLYSPFTCSFNQNIYVAGTVAEMLVVIG